MLGTGMLVLNGCDMFVSEQEVIDSNVAGVVIVKPNKGEDVFGYIQREKGSY